MWTVAWRRGVWVRRRHTTEGERQAATPVVSRESMQEFTYRSARSGSVLIGFGIALLVEAVALHLWLADRHPMLAWLATVSSVAALLWLAGDYRALGRGAVRLGPDVLECNIGRRFALRLPRAAIAAAQQPGWRDLPKRGTPAAVGYLDLTKPATPNVLLILAEPTRVGLPGGFGRDARCLGLHLDAPAAFLLALATPATALASGGKVGD